MGKLKVLIADDEPDILKTLARHIRSRGYDVLTAADGDKALEIFKSEMPDAVLLDVHMPHVDGIMAFREMLDLNPSAAILVMSGALTEDQAHLVIDEGAAALIPKPIDFEKLDRLLESIRPQ